MLDLAFELKDKKMKIVTILLLSVTIVVCEQKKYDLNFDNMDIENMVGDKDNLKMYTDCFLDRGECDVIGAKIRNIIPEALHNACERCTDVHKHNCRRYFEELAKVFPEDLINFQKKYDPEYRYVPLLLAAVKDFK